MADPYRDEKAHLRARIAVLEEQLAEARGNRTAKRTERKRKRKPQTGVPRTAETPSGGLLRWLIGGPDALETTLAVEGTLAPEAHEALADEAVRAGLRDGVASSVGRRFSYTTFDRHNRRMHAIEVLARQTGATLKIWDNVGPKLYLTMLVGLGVVGMMGVVAANTLTDMNPPEKALVSAICLIVTWLLARGVNAELAKRSRLQQEALARRLAAACTPHLRPEQGARTPADAPRARVSASDTDTDDEAEALAEDEAAAREARGKR